MIWQAEMLFQGQAEGEVLRLDDPISFWGGVSPVNSEVILANHLNWVKNRPENSRWFRY